MGYGRRKTGKYYGRRRYGASYPQVSGKRKKRLMIQLLICIVIVLAVIAIKKMDIAIGNKALETFHTQMTKDFTGEDVVHSAKSVMAHMKVLPGPEDSGKNMDFSPPSDHTAAVSTFGEQSGGENGQSGFERGMDFHSDREIQVYAIGGGTVSEISQSSQYGTFLKVSHGNDIVSLYGGCTKVYVKPLEKVKKGQLIASVSPEREGGLHFELWVNGKIVNPADYISF